MTPPRIRPDNAEDLRALGAEDEIKEELEQMRDLPKPYYEESGIMTISPDRRAENRRRLAREAASRHRARLRGENIPLRQSGAKRGYKQHPDHIAKRLRRGADHHGWIGDAAKEATGRGRAERMFPPQPCGACGAPHGERHHCDGNTLNNAPENIRFLCRSCHMREDGRLASLRELGIANLETAIAQAAKVRSAKPTCPRGHPYSGSNLYVNPKGSRSCRQCLNEYKRNKRAGRVA